MGGWTLAVLAGVCACSAGDRDARCKDALEAHADAAAHCEAAYANGPTRERAKQVLSAYKAVARDVEPLLSVFPRGVLAAEIWHTRGIAARERHDTAASISAFETALALRDADDLRGQLNEVTSLSERHLNRGDYRRALVLQARAYELALALGDAAVIAHAGTSLAGQLMTVGDFAGAERALGDGPERMKPDDPFLAIALMQRGLIALDKDRPKIARASLQRAADVLKQRGDHSRDHEIRLNLVDVALALGDLETAQRLIAEDAKELVTPNGRASHADAAARVALALHAWDEARRVTEAALRSDPPATWRPQLANLLGEAHLGAHRAIDAAHAFEEAIAGYEASRGELEFDDLKARAEMRRREPYEHLFALHARAGRALDAFAIVQRMTARTFLDGLLPASDAQMPATPATTTAAIALRAGVRADALRAITGALRTSPVAQPPPVGELVERLRGRTVWTYVVAEERVWRVTLDDGRAAVADLGPLAALRDDLERARTFDRDALARLGAMLVGGARIPERAGDARGDGHLGAGGIVHIAADPPLDRIPFAAITVEGRPMIERVALTYVPSAAVLALLVHRPKRSGAAIVLGDPGGDLAGARAEAIETARRLGVSARLGAEATAERVLGARDARVLAIAAHTDITASGAQLVLADLRVSVAEILEAGIAPGLVVLASCSSASPGVDPWGALGGAFLATGTPTVIASRWALDDAASRRLVADMYAAGGVERTAEGLAIAQRAAIARSEPPRDWAALVVLGVGASPTGEPAPQTSNAGRN